MFEASFDRAMIVHQTETDEWIALKMQKEVYDT